jgi:hypothetical protein
MLEAIIGTLYPAILLARLVTLEIETRRTVAKKDDERSARLPRTSLEAHGREHQAL